MFATIRSRTFYILVEKRKNKNMQAYNFAYGSVRVWNLVSDIKGGT
jgi:hypothetical protein